MKKTLKFICCVVLALCIIGGLGVFAQAEGEYQYSYLLDGSIEITGYSGSANTLVIPDKLDGYVVSVLGKDCFYNSEITAVTIPGSVRKIDERAFYRCSKLVTVTLLEGVTEICNNAFRDCKVLSEMSLPNTLDIIGVNAFYDCSALIELDIPSSVNSVGQRAFYNTGWLAARQSGLVYAGSAAYKYIGEALGGTGISITDGTASVTAEAFYSQTGITTISIPASCKTINYAAFSYCSALRAVTIEPGVATIESYAFYRCGSLSSVMIPSSVTKIGEKAFDGIDGLTIMGVANSAAEQYATENSIAFIVVSETRSELDVALNNSSVAVSIDNSMVTDEQRKRVHNGAPVKLTANPSGNLFLFWTEDGKVRGEELDYSFIMNGARNVNAVFAPGVGEGSLVIYRNTKPDTLQVIAYETCLTPALFSAHLADSAISYGCTFTGWSKSVEQIKEEISSGSPVVYVDAVFTENSDGFMLAVNGGSITEGEKSIYRTGDIVKITTDLPGFTHWKDSDGAIVSVTAQTDYKIGNCNTTLIACNDPLPDEYSILLRVDSTGERLRIYNSYYLNEKCEIVDMGLIYSKSAQNATDMVLECVDGTAIKATHLGAKEGACVQVFNSMSKTAGATLRGYMVYRNAENELITVYSSVYCYT